MKPEIKVHSDHTSNSGGDEEADNQTMARMLEDDRGRLIYIGDASTLSFLQLLRMIVETAVGPSSFTLDPERHKIMETPFSLAPDTELTHLLPEKHTALILVDSFFLNVSMDLRRSEKYLLISLDARFDSSIRRKRIPRDFGQVLFRPSHGRSHFPLPPQPGFRDRPDVCYA